MNSKPVYGADQPYSTFKEGSTIWKLGKLNTILDNYLGVDRDL